MTCSILLICLLLGAQGGRSGEVPEDLEQGAERVRIMWYNVENLFHPGDDSIPGDDEFTPAGARRWSFERYRKKLTDLAKVIVAAGRREPPEVVGLCEVENRQVLTDLVSHPVLAPYDYEVVHAESPDIRGTDVACIYRGEQIGLAGWKAMRSAAPGPSGATRDMLLLELSLGRDTLDLILVHLISKFSGAGATAGFRREQARQLAGVADSLVRCHPGRIKVMAGDFNDGFRSYALEPLRTASFEGDSLFPVPLAGNTGSYKYRGRWSSIDLFLVYGPVHNYTFRGSVFQLPFLLVADETYGGTMPFRTYQGPQYKGGISDHLPVILEVGRSFF